MTRLKTVLDSVLPELTSLGGGGRYVDRDKLVRLLEILSNELARAYWLRASITFLVVILLLAAVWRYSGDPLLLSVLTGAIAMALAGALAALRAVTEDMARVRLLLTVTPDLSLEALTEVARRISSIP